MSEQKNNLTPPIISEDIDVQKSQRVFAQKSERHQEEQQPNSSSSNKSKKIIIPLIVILVIIILVGAGWVFTTSFLPINIIKFWKNH